VLFRRLRGEGPVGIVGQRGESVPEGYVQLTGGEVGVQPELGQLKAATPALAPSPQTKAMVDALVAQAFGKVPS
jgi:hypothetical protein